MPEGLKPTGRPFRQQINDYLDAYHDAIADKLSDCAEIILRRIKMHYLTGAALNVVTNRLRSSITKKPMSGATKIFNKYIVYIGTKVTYGRVWELGFNGIINIPAHTKVISRAFGRPISPVTADISAHSRQVNIDARPFIQPSFEDERVRVRRIMRQVVEQANRRT